MNTNNFIALPYKLERDPPPFEGNAIKYPESLVRHFIGKFTKPRQKVFDPFAGLGTTMFAAEEMGRIPFGIEYDEHRYEWTAGQMENWQNLICGDTLKLTKMSLPKMDFCMTSPPFMPKGDKWNPLSWGNPAKAGYETYLKQMRRAFEQVNDVMKKGARVVVHVDDIPGRIFTPLVRDLSMTIGNVLTLENEVTILWKNAPEDYPLTHCLVFKKS